MFVYINYIGIGELPWFSNAFIHSIGSAFYAYSFL